MKKILVVLGMIIYTSAAVILMKLMKLICLLTTGSYDKFNQDFSKIREHNILEVKHKTLGEFYAKANGRIVELETAVRYTIVDLKYQDSESAQKKLEALGE